jgi:signal transduction histidine kinase
MIRVVIEGVIENAIKYSNQDGTVKLSLATENEDTLLFSIHNNGISIPEAEQPHIFNKFFRAPNAKSSVLSGSGLGLFIAKNIVTQHHGSISFQSSKEAGTTFFIRLPLLPKA